MYRRTDAQVLTESFGLTNLNFKAQQVLTPSWALGLRYNHTEEHDPNDILRTDPTEAFLRFKENLDTYVLSADHQTESSTGMIALSFNDMSTGTFQESIERGISGRSEVQNQERGIFARNTWLFGGGRTLTVGADAVRYSTENPIGSEQVDEGFISPFVYTKQPIGARIELEGGVRATTSGQFGTDLSPEIGVIGKVAPTLALRARGGKAFRVPRLGEIFGTVVNEGLEPENFYHAELGLNKRFFDRRVVFDAALWWMRGDNLIERVGEGPDQVSVNTGEFQHRGLESTLNVRAWNNSSNENVPATRGAPRPRLRSIRLRKAGWMPMRSNGFLNLGLPELSPPARCSPPGRFSQAGAERDLRARKRGVAPWTRPPPSCRCCSVH